MRVERVLQMSVNEIAVRGRQQASKWLDRMTAAKAPMAALNGATLRTAGVRERFAQRFFEGAVRADATARLIGRIPESRDRIMAAAEEICRGRFDLLGYRGLEFGDPVDWHLDPVSGRRAPIVRVRARSLVIDTQRPGNSLVA